MGGKDEEKRVEIEIEGEHIGSSDYCFVALGEPIPTLPRDGPEFDTNSLPLRPLAVSEEHGLLFVAHSNGFLVARTMEAIQLAKDTKEKKSGSIKESCIMDVSIGKVHILALSVDSSTLAASVSGEIHFFSVSSLLNKEQSPSFSISLGNSSCIKDMQWTKRMEDRYVVLSNEGKLYYGAGRDALKHVMDDVDAVEWSVKGKFLAVAINNVLSILSSKFKQKLSMSLSFKSWIDDSGFDGTIKVDSIRWIRPDCIIVGCFHLSTDGLEESYLIQVVTSKDGMISDASSKPIVLSFSNVFEVLIDDIVPFGSGPYMSLGYLDKCELAIAANRKNTDQHIVLMGWPQENEKQAAVIDIVRDTLRPVISLQENGDDNTVLGLCLDKVSYNNKVEVVLGADYKELSPFCLLLCLSLDGKLSMFQVASAVGLSSLSGGASLQCEEEDSPTAVSSEDGFSDYSSNSSTESVEQVDRSVQLQEEHKKELDIEGQIKETLVKESLKHTTLEKLVPVDEPKFSGFKEIQHTDAEQSPFSAKLGTYVRQSTPNASYTAGVEGTAGGLSNVETPERLGGSKSQSLPAKSSANLFTQSTNLFTPSTNLLPQSSGGTLFKENDSGREVSGKLGSATLKAAEDRKSFPVTSTYSLPTSSTMNLGHSNLGATSGTFSISKSTSAPSTTFSIPKSTIGPSTAAPSTAFSIPKLTTDPLSAAPSTASSIPKSTTGLFTSAPSTAFSSSGGVSHGGAQPLPMTSGITKSLPGNRKSPMSFQSSTFANSFKDQHVADKDNNRSISFGRTLNSDPHSSKQFGKVEEMIRELETLLEGIEGPGGFRDACTVHLNSSILELEEGMGTLFSRWRRWKRIMDEQLVEVQLLRDQTVQVAAKKIYMEGIVKQATDSQYWDLWNCQKLSPELELKRQHILTLNQELTSQVIELERHLNNLEIKSFGEDRQPRQRGVTSRYGSSRPKQSLRSLQDIMSSQLAAADKLSETLSRQMTLLSVESPTTKKQDARRELFEEIGIPYSNASFGFPEEKRAISTPSNKVLASLNFDNVNSSSRRDKLGAIRSLGSESTRRRRDTLDQSWVSFEPPKTTVKRMNSQEGRNSPSVDRSSLSTGKIPTTTLQSSNDRGIWERTLNPAFETSPATSQTSYDSSGFIPHSKSLLKNEGKAHQAPSFSKRLPDQTFSLSKSMNEMSNSSDRESSFLKSSFGSLSDKPNTTNMFSQSQGLKSATSPSLAASVPNFSSEVFRSNNPVNKNEPQSGVFASSFSSSSFSIFGSASSLNSSISPPSTFLKPSVAPLSAAVSMNDSSSKFKDSNDVTQTVVPSKSSVPSPSIFGGSSFTLSSSFPVPSTSPTPSVAPVSPAVSLSNSSSSLKASGIDSKTLLPSQSTVSSLLLFGSDSSSKVPEKPVPSSISTPSENLSSESREKEPQPPLPGVNSKIDGNTSLQASFPKPEAALNIETSALPVTPTIGASTRFQSASSPTLSSTTPAVSDSSNSKPELAIAKDFLSPASEIEKTENQGVTADQEDDMEEEAPETSLTTQLNFGGLGGFGLGSAPNSTTPKQNPFGSSFANATPTPVSSPFSVPSGEIFRPASFSFQSPSTPAPQPTGFGSFSGGFGTGNTVQAPAAGGFGQPSKIGAGQQALGSVLGSFGQSRQFGVAQPVATSPVGFGGSSGSPPSSDGFAGIASGGGGFASLASAAGGFGAAANSGGGFGAVGTSGGGGGFAGAASPSAGGFGRLAPAAGGFGGMAPAGGGFGGVASGGFGGVSQGGGGGFGGAAQGGGFGAFNSQQGSGGFSSFGNNAGGTARPPSSLFTQMRK